MMEFWERISQKNARFDAMKDTVLRIIAQGYPLSAGLDRIQSDVMGKTQTCIPPGKLTDLQIAEISEKLAQVSIYCELHCLGYNWFFFSSTSYLFVSYPICTIVILKILCTL
jgi:hypothetical protein